MLFAADLSGIPWLILTGAVWMAVVQVVDALNYKVAPRSRLRRTSSNGSPSTKAPNVSHGGRLLPASSASVAGPLSLLAS